MTTKLAAHDDGDRTGGRIAMPIADEIAEAVLAGKARLRCVGHVLAIGRGSAELGPAYRGNGQGVAIGIAVVRQHVDGDRLAARGIFGRPRAIRAKDKSEARRVREW